MKKILMLLATSILGAGYMMAQDLRESQVPESVRQGFKNKYGGSYVYEWEYKRKAKEYEAEFMLNGEKYDAYFSTSGQWLRSERDIRRNEVPEAVYAAVRNSEYGRWEIDDIELVETPEHPILYQVEVESPTSGRERYLWITPSGEIVRNVAHK